MNKKTSNKAKISVFFNDLESELISLINDADEVYGCVAWLTNKNIISAISKKHRASIIVQKEDFLRPDFDGYSNEKLRQLYGLIKGSERILFQNDILSSMEVADSRGFDGVRCVGNCNSEKSPCHPRMHNKFIVFCRTDASVALDFYVHVFLLLVTPQKYQSSFHWQPKSGIYQR